MCVDSASIKNIFEDNGYEFLYEKSQYQFYVYGLFDKIVLHALLLEKNEWKRGQFYVISRTKTKT